MKRIIKILFLCFTFLHTQCKGDTIPYIKIEFSAPIESRVLRPLFISSRKLNIKLDTSEKNEYESLIKHHFPITVDQFINIHYNLLLTDRATFKIISKYIKNQQKNYLKSDTAKIGFSVTLTWKANFFVPYGPSDKFFIDMIEYLKSKHCDKHVISELHKLQSYNYI